MIQLSSKEQQKLEMFRFDYELIDTDVIGTLESINPSLAKNSKSYKDSNKYIFKQNISYENAEELMNIITNTVEDLYKYKSDIKNKCNMMLITGESPTEMIIYATKKIADRNIYYSIFDILKHLQEKDSLFVQSYHNILINWTWNECLNTVLKSIKDIHLHGLESELFEVFEKNEVLRNEVAMVLIDLDSQQYFESILNFLVVQSNDTSEQLEKLKEIAAYMGLNSENGSKVVYKVYLQTSMKWQVAKNLVTGIRNNLSNSILEDIERNLQSPNSERIVYDRLIYILKKSNKLPHVKKVLQKLANYVHLDQAIINDAMGGENFNINKKIALNKNADIKMRINAIINLAKQDKKEIKSLLEELYEDSDRIRIAVSCVWIEQGNTDKISTLFGYLIGNNDEQIVNDATNQLKRLKSLGNPELNQKLTRALQTVLQNKTVPPNIILRVLDLYFTGTPNEDVAIIFLNKLKETKNHLVKDKIYSFFIKNWNKFNVSLQQQIKAELISQSQETGEYQRGVMECLKKFNQNKDAVPIIREDIK